LTDDAIPPKSNATALDADTEKARISPQTNERPSNRLIFVVVGLKVSRLVLVKSIATVSHKKLDERHVSMSRGKKISP
jgi:hypothetical protein